MSRRVMIAVTHLLGVGHLVRAAAIARALANAGHTVLLVSGGRHSPLVRLDGVQLVTLPAIHCVGTDFRTLLNDAGQPADAAFIQARLDRITGAASRFAPDVVITELYPFGRRQLTAEYEALIAACQTLARPPVFLCSIRDVLNPPGKPEKALAALERLGSAYDSVLVHGDEEVTPLSLSWPVAPALARRLIYTGYIANEAGADPHPVSADGAEQRVRDILVSGGASEASLPLYRTALAAALLVPDRRWHLLVGHGVSGAAFASLQAEAAPHILVERARPDFLSLLRGCAVSVSQAGYNTVTDLALTGARAVLVPFEAGDEKEQTLRAQALASRGLALVLRDQVLTPAALAHAIREAMRRPAPIATVSLAGSRHSVAAVEHSAAGRDRLLAARARLLDALASLKRHNLDLRVWWRDDDAVEPGPALDRLLALARQAGAPVALAVIPAGLDARLADRLADEPLASVLVHGWSHQNHAPEGAKSMELGWREPESVLGELAAGLERVERIFGQRALPVLVPPWNRIDPALIPRLSGIGFEGLSVFGPRRHGEAAHSLVLVNTHLDPIDWRGGGGLADPARLLDDLAAHIRAMIEGRQDHNEPFGLLTHHLVQDAWTWRFIAGLLDMLHQADAVRFVSAREVFRPDDGPVVD